MKELQANSFKVENIQDLAKFAEYSLMNTLNCDPDATEDGVDYSPRQVFTGHYVPVKSTPIEEAIYISHSRLSLVNLVFLIP